MIKKIGDGGMYYGSLYSNAGWGTHLNIVGKYFKFIDTDAFDEFKNKKPQISFNCNSFLTLVEIVSIDNNVLFGIFEIDNQVISIHKKYFEDLVFYHKNPCLLEFKMRN